MLNKILSSTSCKFGHFYLLMTQYLSLCSVYITRVRALVKEYKTSYKVLYFIGGLIFFDKSYFYVIFWLCLISLPKLYLKTRTCNT